MNPALCASSHCHLSTQEFSSQYLEQPGSYALDIIYTNRAITMKSQGSMLQSSGYTPDKCFQWTHILSPFP